MLSSTSPSHWSKSELSESSPFSCSNPHATGAKVIEINGQDDVWAIALLAEERYIVSGGNEGKIRQWRVGDGMEEGTPMDAKGTVRCVTVSQDGKWIVTGTTSRLYERLYDLPPLSLVSGRLRLPGIVFPLTSFAPLLTPDSEPNAHVYRVMTPMLGNVDIKTTDDSLGTDGLLFIHPWISPLLDHDFSHGVAHCDVHTRALRLVVRLLQPFGALLLAPHARAQYRRVATDSLIMVQVCEEVALGELMEGIRTVDIQ